MLAFQGATLNGIPENRAGVERTLAHRWRAVFAYSCFVSLRPSNRYVTPPESPPRSADAQLSSAS
jgi:hypothetical protein